VSRPMVTLAWADLLNNCANLIAEVSWTFSHFTYCFHYWAEIAILIIVPSFFIAELILSAHFDNSADLLL
jgi:hypothetical protein